jgi:hypothetical protein
MTPGQWGSRPACPSARPWSRWLCLMRSCHCRCGLLQERLFFERHSVYRTIASRMGTPYLTRALNTILMHHVRDCLPDLKARISTMLLDVQVCPSSVRYPPVPTCKRLRRQAFAPAPGSCLPLLACLFHPCPPASWSVLVVWLWSALLPVVCVRLMSTAWASRWPTNPSLCRALSSCPSCLASPCLSMKVHVRRARVFCFAVDRIGLTQAIAAVIHARSASSGRPPLVRPHVCARACFPQRWTGTARRCL